MALRAASARTRDEHYCHDSRHGDPAAALQPGERFDLVLALEVVEHVVSHPQEEVLVAIQVVAQQPTGTPHVLEELKRVVV